MAVKDIILSLVFCVSSVRSQFGFLPFGMAGPSYGFGPMVPFSHPSRFTPNIAAQGPMRNAPPGSIMAPGFSPLQGLSIPGGGALVTRLPNSRQLIVPSTAGAFRGQQPLLLPAGTAMSGIQPVSPGIAAQSERLLSPMVPPGSVVRGIMRNNVVNALTYTSARTPRIQQLGPFGYL